MTTDSIESMLAERSHSPLFARLADSYLAAGNITEAKELCRSGLLNYPRYTTAHLILAKCFAAENNYEEALPHLDEALQYLPGNSILEQLKINWQSGGEQQPENAILPDDETNVAEIETQGEEQQEEVYVIPAGNILPSSEEPIEVIDTQQSAGKILLPEETNIAEIGTPAEQQEEIHAIPAEDLSSSTEELTDEADTQQSPGMILLPEETNIAEETETWAEPPEEIHIIPTENVVQSNEELTDATDTQHSQAHEVVLEEPAAEEIPIEHTAPVEIEHPAATTLQNEPAIEEKQEIIASSVTEQPQDSQDIIAHASEPIIEIPAAQPVITTAGGNSEFLLPLVLNDEGRIVSKTLAEIYVKQGEFGEAIITYKLLKQQRPQFAAEYEHRINDLELQLKEKTST